MADYLGDGVYIKTIGEAAIIYTSDGYEEKNHIYLGPNELECLRLWLDKLDKEKKGNS